MTIVVLYIYSSTFIGNKWLKLLLLFRISIGLIVSIRGSRSLRRLPLAFRTTTGLTRNIKESGVEVSVDDFGFWFVEVDTDFVDTDADQVLLYVIGQFLREVFDHPNAEIVGISDWRAMKALMDAQQG